MIFEPTTSYSGKYSNAPIPVFPRIASLSRIETSAGLIRIFISIRSIKRRPQPSGRLSAKTPKFPLKGSRDATKTFFSRGSLNGDIEKPLRNQSELYSKAAKCSEVKAK